MILTADAIVESLVPSEVDGQPLLVLDPFNSDQLNPNSYDLRLKGPLLSPWHMEQQQDPGFPGRVVQDLPYLLRPGELWLAATAERMGSRHLVPQLAGKSTLARAGLQVHQGAGYGDLGFIGNWTLTLSLAPGAPPLLLAEGMRIAQVYFTIPQHAGDWQPGARVKLYGGKYAGSDQPLRADLTGIYAKSKPEHDTEPGHE